MTILNSIFVIVAGFHVEILEYGFINPKTWHNHLGHPILLWTGWDKQTINSNFTTLVQRITMDYDTCSTHIVERVRAAVIAAILLAVATLLAPP